jgi:N-acetylmuramoyl-L-alanine amidase
VAAAAPAGAVEVRQSIRKDVAAVIQGGRMIFLEVRLPPADALQAFLKEFLADESDWTIYRERIAVGIPFARLNPATQRTALEVLFPHDYVDEKGWWHTVTFEGEEGVESWFSLAEWLTGMGTNYKRLREVPENSKSSEVLKKGQVVLVPKALLREEFREASLPLIAALGEVAPPAKRAAPESEAKATSQETLAKRGKQAAPVQPALLEQPAVPLDADAMDDEEDHQHIITETSGQPDSPADEDDRSAAPPDASELKYGKDKQGAYAEYRLKQGESLYSAVVVRFTDYRENADIHAACKVVQARSRISDPTKMGAGQRVLIPVEMLADAYQPAGTERRQEYESVRAEATRLKGTRAVAKGLEGVVIILDPGHGGRDHGAAVPKAGLYEDELTYDICLRMKKILESETRAKVIMTLHDPDHGPNPTNKSKFVHDTDEYLLTTPIYKNQDAKISANLRWYVANDYYRKAKKAGTKEENMMFISMHCDSLFNERLRGAMVYIPGAQYRRESERPAGAIYASYAEVRSQPEVKTTSSVRKRDEALSRNFAELLLKSLRTNDPPIKVHDAGDPVRNVIRQSGGRAYVPAVLRNTQVPTKVLVEAVNLMNATDRKRVSEAEWRQWFAEAMVRAIKAHFGS